MKIPIPPPPFPPGQSGAAQLGKALAKVMADGVRLKQLRAADLDYPPWEKFMRRVRSWGIAPELLWHVLKFDRSRTQVVVEVQPSADFRFHYNLTHGMQRTLHEFDMHMGGAIGGSTTIPQGTSEQLLTSTLMEEAIASSQLEGASTTRKVAKEMLRANRAPKNEHERMILNNYRTIRDLLEFKREPLTKDLIKRMHRTIAEGTLEDAGDVGVFRTTNEVAVYDQDTNEIVYGPPDHGRLEELMDAVCAFANDRPNEPFIHPIVRGIILHFLIGYIHPFVDGNGRTARALFYWCLLRQGYWMVEYLSISRIILNAKQAYARAYLHTEQDDLDLTYFLSFNLRSLHLAMESLNAYVKRKQDDRRVLFQVIKNAKVNERQADLLRLFMKEPERMVSIEEAKHRFKVVYQTARTDMLGLQQLGFLDLTKSGNKMLFHRSENFERRLANIERNDPSLPFPAN
jgi:Fic family protein